LKRFFTLLVLLAVVVTIAASQPGKVVEVKVLSFNIRHGENRWGKSNLRAILKVIQEQKPHLVALQAVDSLDSDGEVRFQLRQLAIQTGMYYAYGASDSTTGGSQGVGILSKWPFEKTQKLQLPTSPGSDPRVLLCGLVMPARGFTFRFCNARLEYASVFDRALQAAYINRMLDESIQPVLLAMDMGARPNEQPYFSFRKKWMDAARGSLLPTWTEGVPGDRLDYIMVLKNTRVNVKNYKVLRQDRDASDHFPIVATVEFW
jgi:endonuclease/exonuclease/phosphatase family metal-dependent hydrolase